MAGAKARPVEGDGSSEALQPIRRLLKPASTLACVLLLLYSAYRAYDIRLHSVRVYGKVIHEFDPWFNYRATQYLSDNGWRAFFEWYDYMSWYPLGRPVGTTIFPGMQITGVVIHRILAALGHEMSINDICVYMPAWFGSIATVLASLISYESSRSVTVAAFTAYFFAIVPAHLMRSMAGEFDNECVAVTAMLLTFYMWIRALRSEGSWPIGALAGVAYGYMASTWGGYVFVLNMVALHTATSVIVDWVRGTYNAGLVKAYSLFFVVGTSIAVNVPPVHWMPFRSLEQLMALLGFFLMWALHFSEYLRHRDKLPILCRKTLRIRARVLLASVALLTTLSVILEQFGFFSPVSYRVRALFMKHTHTGNPLVDSVAEHRATSAGAYLRYLNICYPLWFFGVVVMLLFARKHTWHAAVFNTCFSVAALYFSSRMSRLILLAGPPAALGTGILLGTVYDWALCLLVCEESKTSSGNSSSRSSKKVHSITSQRESSGYVFPVDKLEFMSSRPRGFQRAFAVLVIAIMVFNPTWRAYDAAAQDMADAFSNPRILFHVSLGSGERVMIDDYYVSYLWLRNNTPEDARILSWWDYGYQVTGIGNRTSLADGNTWNHRHIATIGKLLTSPVQESHSLVRHLADYVLIWAGEEGSDLMKSPHMARIGNSVYHDICPKGDPSCHQFGFYNGDFNQPTPMMERSLLYNLHHSEIDSTKKMDERYFKHVYSSRFGLVKIFKVMNVSEESKAWVADPRNRRCNPPGSWLCSGQYPPAKEIQDLLAKRRGYEQV
ncbi:putative Oligosaccharyl transferase STT3 subunit [Trypanosoma vivax]|nr:putative Oligosaccharyl transferase STT3 subunit [Trypanosoma vivax]